MSALPDDLLDPQAYPHHVAKVLLIETHLSWVFLTGAYAYKVKKPVRFEFVDFSLAERRQRCCAEELRCNRRFAGDLYIDVCPIVRTEQGRLQVAHAGTHVGKAAPVEDWAVRMRQFDHTQQADLLLESGQLSADELEAFGRLLAQQHQALPKCFARYQPQLPILANFETLRALQDARINKADLERLHRAAIRDYRAKAALLLERMQTGYVRECHGDLHLANIVRRKSGLCAFDCLEFSEDLRRIDVMSDVAFLYMDCMIRGRSDLAYSFLDGYLDQCGDYQGATLLPLFSRYRSMVRAKVAALCLQQAPDDAAAADQLRKHLSWSDQQSCAAGRLIVMNGVSGTGKSYWARALARELGAVRIRSDVLRKLGTPVSDVEPCHALATGLYDESVTNALYEQMANLAEQLLHEGQSVIIDAACLQLPQRAKLYAAAARSGVHCLLVRLQASTELLEQRLVTRARLGTDPSDADQAVLQWQLHNQDLPGSNEPVLVVNTDDLSLRQLTDEISSASSSR